MLVTEREGGGGRLAEAFRRDVVVFPDRPKERAGGCARARVRVHKTLTDVFP